MQYVVKIPAVLYVTVEAAHAAHAAQLGEALRWANEQDVSAVALLRAVDGKSVLEDAGARFVIDVDAPPVAQTATWPAGSRMPLSGGD